jgi:hypothetical protein
MSSEASICCSTKRKRCGVRVAILHTSAYLLHAQGLKHGDTCNVMPEYILPYVLHLCAHSNNFPDGEDDEDRVQHIEKYVSYVRIHCRSTAAHRSCSCFEVNTKARMYRCIDFVISVLVNGVDGGGDNLSFLMRVRVRSHARVHLHICYVTIPRIKKLLGESINTWDYMHLACPG